MIVYIQIGVSCCILIVNAMQLAHMKKINRSKDAQATDTQEG